MDRMEWGALIATGLLAAVLVPAAAISGGGGGSVPPPAPPTPPIGPTGTETYSCNEICCGPGGAGIGPAGCAFSVNADGVCTCG
ncbi:MAG: hypothetical protein ABSH07_12725 [Candidatus Dormibacteria bacterium]|jgi:hypothetical protein